MTKFSVVVPVYCNAGSLPALETALQKLELDLKEMGVALELIFVNDASLDESLEILRQIQSRRPTTLVLNHLSNQGALPAVKTGLRYVTGDCFTYLAADLQDPPELLPEMVLAWKQGARFIVRVRASREDPPLTKLFAWIHYGLVRTFIMPSYPRGGFDMAVMDKVFLPNLLKCGPNRHFSMYIWSMGVPAKVLTYHRRERAHGRSMWTFRKKLHYFIDSSVSFSVKPMRLATATGLVIAIVCFLYTAVVITGRLLGLIPVAGFATLAAMLGFLQGCAFIFLGLLGEYVWRIYMEMDRHPGPVVEEITPREADRGFATRGPAG